VPFNIKIYVVEDCKVYCLLVCDAVMFGSKLPIFIPDCASSTLEDSYSTQRKIHSSFFMLCF